MRTNPHSSRPEQFGERRAENAATPLRRVLIVEDEFFLAVQVEEWLLAAGFEVIDIAFAADEAVAIAVADRPALVFMDIRLANESDGIVAACEILARTGIRCIFASAYADPPTVARGEAARPFGWLRKPFSAAAVVEAANRALDELRNSAGPR